LCKAVIRTVSSVLAVLFCLIAVSAMQVPRGLPLNQWRKRIPVDNPMTAEKVKLGEALYFDKRLSADGTVSCATCHDPASAFTDRNATAVGVRGTSGTRSAPTVLNAMFSSTFFWDGRAHSLEEQAKQPLVSATEMGMQSYDAVVTRVAGDPDYVQKFRRVFSSEVTIDTIVKALAAYERTQLSGNSPFDRFMAGSRNAISPAQKRGWALFRGKAQCIECHAFSHDSPFFTDFDFHNTGATKGAADAGRYVVTKQSSDTGAFKTPTLRDIELTAPYMHDGSQKTLLDVVRFYSRGGEANPYLDHRISQLNLTDEEMNALVEFMRALTSDDVLHRTQTTKPQTRVAVTLNR
jgi:cytochrome c peroxidase